MELAYGNLLNAMVKAYKMSFKEFKKKIQDSIEKGEIKIAFEDGQELELRDSDIYMIYRLVVDVGQNKEYFHKNVDKDFYIIIPSLAETGIAIHLTDTLT